jgi:hypothetical protein
MEAKNPVCGASVAVTGVQYILWHASTKPSDSAWNLSALTNLLVAFCFCIPCFATFTLAKGSKS